MFTHTTALFRCILTIPNVIHFNRIYMYNEEYGYQGTDDKCIDPLDLNRI
jgi:hypothetical protein